LNILYVGTLPPHHGGSAIAGAHLLVGLASRGHEVQAIAPLTKSDAAAADRFDRTHRALGVRRFLVPSFETSPDVPAAPEYRELEGTQIRALFTDARAVRGIDVVISGRESFAWHVPELTRRDRVPWVQIVAGSSVVGILRGTYPSAPGRALLGRFHRADAVITPAAYLARALADLGVPGVHAIPNPVDLDRFQPGPKSNRLLRSLGIEKSDLVILHVSNLKTLKRIEDLIAAVELLPPSLSLSCLIVGRGPNRPALERLVADKRLQERIRFVDWVDYDRVPDFINSADLVVMPSAGEAQALVYLEAQACARTLIASDIPAAREVIEDGKTGLLFRTGDPTSLADTITSAAADPELRATIGRNARERVKSHAAERIVAAYEAVLEGVVSTAVGRDQTPRRRTA
jgi:glycosyltransferase involved in cell wall biosynthesis